MQEQPNELPPFQIGDDERALREHSRIFARRLAAKYDPDVRRARREFAAAFSSIEETIPNGHPDRLTLLHLESAFNECWLSAATAVAEIGDDAPDLSDDLDARIFGLPPTRRLGEPTNDGDGD
jgi:hypothetical protein